MRKNLNLPAKGKRQIYDLTPFKLPEVPYLAAQNLPFATMALPTHVHKGRMEINHILKGERVYRVGNKDYRLRGNQIFVTWPDEVHGSGASLHGRGMHFWMQVALPQPGEAFLGLGPERAAPVVRALWELPKRHFPATEEMRGIFSRILHLCRLGPTELASARLTALVIEWLLEVIDSSSLPLENDVTPDIGRVIDLMEENPLAHYSVNDLAEASHLSESRFKAKFSRQIGMPPGDYIQRHRLEVALRLLLQGRTVAQAAEQLGFSSSQHFSTAFKKFFGKSPVAWLKANAQNTRPEAEHGLDNQFDENGLRPWMDEEGWFHGHICREPL